MTPLEKALSDADKIDYCDQCANFIMVRGWGYCKDSGKLIHPMMVERGQGYGPARGCKRARRADNADASN